MEKSQTINIVFMGTPEFAIPSLRLLHEAPDMCILRVVSQPDRPSGRGLKPKAPPIARLAKELNLELHQPSSLKDPEFCRRLFDVSSDANPRNSAVCFPGLPR